MIQLPGTESMSPLTSSTSIQTPHESLGSVVDTVCRCTSTMEQQDNTTNDPAPAPVHDASIQDVSQVISLLVNDHNVRHMVWPVVLLVLSMVLCYVFIVRVIQLVVHVIQFIVHVIQVDKEIV